MRSLFRNPIVTIILILAVSAVGVFLIFTLKKLPPPEIMQPVEIPKDVGPKQEVLGISVGGRKIESFTYGTGTTHVAFVGGIHGGYEWNSVLLAYQFMDYLAKYPSVVPENLRITIIPNANPDAVFKVTGTEGRFEIADVSTNADLLKSARFNAHEVDLNRNFDCNWKPESTWQSKTVSAGTAAFSEPESQAIKNFALKNSPSAVVFWHSQANTVYASECNDGILPVTLDIMNSYAAAAGYQTSQVFDSYAITGDAEGWLASIKIPAITVELKTHESVEFDQNLAGIKAVLNYFSKK